MKKMMLAISLLMVTLVANCQTAKNQPIENWKITDVENYIAQSKDTVLVINFWATFCKPCVAEIPFFIKRTNELKSKGVSLLLISLDLPSYYPAKIAAFAKQHKFTTNIVWLSETNADYFCPKIDAKWSGSIPATLMVNKQTGVRKFYEEEMTEAEFESRLKEVIGQ